jgi:hypothetical protein
MGAARYPDATRLMIIAGAGGSNSYHSRAWKIELAKLAASLGVVVTLWHALLATSQWNKIERRLFGFMSMNSPVKPLTTHRVIVELIVDTITQTRRGVEVDLGYGYYPLTRLRRLKHEGPVHEVAWRQFLPYIA